jgi:CheY-specific phosphatase CheX
MILEKEVCFNQLLLESARENFETMIFMGVQEVDQPDQSIEGAALMGTITFKEALEGSFSIACSKDCARTIALNMLGMEPSEELSDEEVCDAIGEVTNLIMGSIKKNLQDHVDTLIVSVPLVISGTTLNNNLGEGSQKVTVFLNIEDEYLAELTMSYRNNVNC